MTRSKVSTIRVAIVTVVAPLIALAVALPSSLSADTWNQLTKVTFNQPVEIPGQVLPAGTYWFKLLNSQSDRDLVQIYNSDQSKQIALIMAVPDYRTRPSGKTVVTFRERASDAPEAIKAWFYPGDNYGQRFVYPKARAQQLAKRTNQPVPSMPAAQEANTKQPASANEASASAMRHSELKAQQPTGEETEVTTIVTTPPQLLAQNNPPARPASPAPADANANTGANASAARHNHARLPETASPFPLIALGGFFFIGLGVTIGRFNSASASAASTRV